MRSTIDFSSLQQRQRQQRIQAVSYIMTFIMGMLFALTLVWAGWSA